ncbi:MAG: ECF transporter S component [Nanoarchaeota archaeon]|nr:ECF transporter S component [Nanoarchaeota archaeon]MBU1029917.1 ECF transporter S component [Nanoarchaeota archaeon]MBU1850521.1 ECF transporter S component [Nanoarchaeota archaeon]
MSQKTILKQKKKSQKNQQKTKINQKIKQKDKVKSKSGIKKRIAIHALEKQLTIIKLREWLIVIGFILGGAGLRSVMQVVPSAEPITFFAILSGWLFGKKKGFITGAGTLFASNFLVMGGQGPWTIFQAIGFGIAGFLGGFLKGKSGRIKAIIIVIIATVIFEITVNLGSLMIFPGGLFLFLTALPFTLIHLVSNTIFAVFIPKTKKFIEEKGEFNQREICQDLLKKLKLSKTDNENL